jgi:hypothetical protein
MASNTAKSSDGFLMRPTRNVTRRDIILICDRLGEMFGTGWKFEPEQISEGGITITRWPGKTDEMYKSMRFKTTYPSEILRNDWPSIRLPDYREEWLQSDDIIFKQDPTLPKKRSLEEWLCTFLKTREGAPLWTLKELKMMEFIFEEFGISVNYQGCTVKN